MIYIVKKHSRSHRFCIRPGDIEAKKRLLSYRERHWKITAIPGDEPKEPHPAPRAVSSQEKTHERRERRFTRILGRRVVID